jgi:hypothetical protein
MAQSVAAQSRSKPSVPEFTLSFEWHSSDKPAVYDADPYTGQQRELQAAQHYEWGTITVTIKNQPFTPSQASDGNTLQDTGLYYSIRTKGHFADQWTTGSSLYKQYYPQSSGETTEVTFYVGPNAHDVMLSNMVLNAPQGGQVDFQVQALAGYVTPMTSVTISFGVQNYQDFKGTEGDWSGTRTVTVGDGSSVASASTPPLSPSPAPTEAVSPDLASPDPTPTAEAPVYGNSVSINLDWMQAATLALLGIIAVLLALTVVYLRKRSVAATAHA